MRERVKAIETEYKGHLFRSRLEARWAVFFDALGIKYLYEPEGFEMDDGTRYLPDFYLPDADLWVEVKPSAFVNELHKGISFVSRSKDRKLLILSEIPEEKSLYDAIRPNACYMYCFPVFSASDCSVNTAETVTFIHSHREDCVFVKPYLMWKKIMDLSDFFFYTSATSLAYTDRSKDVTVPTFGMWGAHKDLTALELGTFKRFCTADWCKKDIDFILSQKEVNRCLRDAYCVARQYRF